MNFDRASSIVTWTLMCSTFIFTLGSCKYLKEGLPRDALLDMAGRLDLYKYPYKVWYIPTEDGYILKCYQINTKCKTHAPPIVLMHGVFASSISFIGLGPKNSLGFIVADLCYDTWICNLRGNYESRNHTTLNPDDPKFWDFSNDELGRYDLPAIFDRVLHESKYDKLTYIGHSQGTTAFFIFSSLFPKKSSKIVKAAHLMAPVAFMTHTPSKTLRLFSTYTYPLEVLAYAIGLYEIGPRSYLSSRLASVFCSLEFLELSYLCENAVFLISGADPDHYNSTSASTAYVNSAGGSSSKTLAHFGQMLLSGKFRNYDYRLLGRNSNKKRYGTSTPPDYRVQDIKVPLFFYYGENDGVTSPVDVEYLASLIRNVNLYRVPDQEFEHFDFLIADDVMDLVYNELKKNLDSTA